VTPERTQFDVGVEELSTAVAGLLADGHRVALAAAHDDGDVLRVVYVLLASAPDRRVELTVRVPAASPRVPTLAQLSYPAGRFEREMHDLFGIVPVDHPLPRRLVRHGHWPAGWYPMRRGAGPSPGFTEADPYPFLTVEGTGVYEIPVGPVHAGLIEPGHFRFSVVGETILRLKVRLWYLHRGVERLFEGVDALAATPLAERISGDTSVGHALAHTLAVEDALGIVMPERGQRLRAVLLELERLYNHVADLGALANDVGYGIAQAHAQALRERLLRLNASVTGHRLLREATRPGAVELRALPPLQDLLAVAVEVQELAEATLAHSVVLDRFEGTAVLSTGQARDLGCLGYVARSSGLWVDARVDHPFTPLPVTPVVRTTGDVLARYQVRVGEVASSTALLEMLLEDAGPLSVTATPTVRGASHGLGVVEGWRGTVVHRVEVDGTGRLVRAKVVDPSWFNWPAVPLAMKDTIVPDFPLTNKSFNLSYAGNDL
jgi:Ni,Fe-hydrogenase III large subunit/Ni,Fe-hydrogenase III component G